MRQRLSHSKAALSIGDWFKPEKERYNEKYEPEIGIIDEFFVAVDRELRSNDDVKHLIQFIRKIADSGIERADLDVKNAVGRVLTRIDVLANAHMRRFRPEVLKELSKKDSFNNVLPSQIIEYITTLRKYANLTLKNSIVPTLFLKKLGVPNHTFNDADSRIVLGSKVNPWTAMDSALNDLIRAYWSDETDPREWDEARGAIIDQGINPDDWRPPVRERTATALSFPRPGRAKMPVAYDLPADAALDNGEVGPIRVGNVLVGGQEPPVMIAGTVRIVPTGWSGVSIDAEYAVLVGLVLDDIDAQYAGRFVQVTGKGTYEVSLPTGEVRTVTLHVKGVLTASPALTTVMSDADAAGTARVAAAKGLYGFPSYIEKTASVANRRLAREAAKIARAAMKKDAGVVDFFKTHAKRDGSRAAKVLLAALKETLPRVAAAAEVGMYGHKARTAQVGIQACADVKLAAGRIAAELHGRKSGEHARITSFLKTHAAKGKCAYSGMLLSCYPDAPVDDVPPEVVPPRLASMRVPASVRDWLASED